MTLIGTTINNGSRGKLYKNKTYVEVNRDAIVVTLSLFYLAF